MKLLLDQSLSPRLSRTLAAVYPGTTHVSKDADLHQRRFVLGHPPKVVWIRRGNCSTAEIEEILRARQADLLAFELDEHGAFLALG